MTTSNAEDRIAVEKEFLTYNLDGLNSEKGRINTRIQHLQNELSDLAFHNYRTYVDVGRTAEHCKEMFIEMNGFMQQWCHEFPALLEQIKQFREGTEKVFGEYKTLGDVGSTNNFIWQILKLPKLMDKCIRAGRYEQAYALTNFAVSVKQSTLSQNSMIKNVVDVLIEARHNLLDELFSKFAGPIDLARSIQLVNNIRKIPYISNTQLRVSILQYRDIFMEKTILRIMSEPDSLLRIIGIYRECMYDTIVLYLAVFPDNDKRKAITMNEDPRWERWTGNSQTYLLQSWAQRNIEKLFAFMRGVEQKSCFDMEAMQSKLMSFAFSFGRMGLDFRPLIVHEFSQMIIEMFGRKVVASTNCLTELQKLDLIDGDIFDNTRQDIEDRNASSAVDLATVLSAPLELCIWDDICVFGNFLVDALNEVRHLLSITLIRPIFTIILASLQSVFKWVDSFLFRPEDISASKKAIGLLLEHFVPFLNNCLFHCFPYEQFAQFFNSSHCSMQDYRNNFKLLSKDLFVLCKQNGIFDELLENVQRKEVEIDEQIRIEIQKGPEKEDKESSGERMEKTDGLDGGKADTEVPEETMDENVGLSEEVQQVAGLSAVAGEEEVKVGNE